MAVTSRRRAPEPTIDDLTLGLDEGPQGDARGRREPSAGAEEPGFVIRTDGAARGNPGPASCGAVLIALGVVAARKLRVD